MELARRPCFIFYKLVEALIQQVDEVLVLYRQELLACEERTFKQVTCNASPCHSQLHSVPGRPC